MNYYIFSGTIIALLWSLIIVIGLITLSFKSDSNLFCWGPSDVEFLNIKINTWEKWSILMLYSIFSQLAYTTVSSTISPYIDNVIRDHKTPLREKCSYNQGQIIVFIYTLFNWLTSIIDIFIWITLQMQFIIIPITIDLFLNCYFTHGYMKQKNQQLLE